MSSNESKVEEQQYNNPAFEADDETGLDGAIRPYDESEESPSAGYDETSDGEASTQPQKKRKSRGSRGGAGGSSTSSEESYHPKERGEEVVEVEIPEDDDDVKNHEDFNSFPDGKGNGEFTPVVSYRRAINDDNTGDLINESYKEQTPLPDNGDVKPSSSAGSVLDILLSPGASYCRSRNRFLAQFEKHKHSIYNGFFILLVLIYLLYLGLAVRYSWDEPDPYFVNVRFLLAATCLFTLFTLLSLLWKHMDKLVNAKKLGQLKDKFHCSCCSFCKSCCNSRVMIALKWLVIVCVISALFIFLGYDIAREDINRLISAVGLIFFILFGYMFSKHPGDVRWRPVVWGLVLQFIMGLIVLRWSFGKQVFSWLGARVTHILSFSDRSSAFVFGSASEHGAFAFRILMLVVFFSSMVSILYYWGVMQAVVGKFAFIMQKTMHTTGAESMTAAANIFIGMTEAPLLIKPYLMVMTRSELHTVMTGGFATVAGGVLAAYIEFGARAEHMIAASVMSAPAALAISKLMYPETEESHLKNEEDCKLEKSQEHNVIEAAANGASQAISLVANIGANLIAFLAILYMLDSASIWVFGMVGHPEVTFQVILAYLFWPLALIMGVDISDCYTVGKLLGIKTFFNEFIAYQELGALIKDGVLKERSAIIATYALCGFSNFGSIGVQIGALGAMAPQRKSDLAQMAVRAMVAGTIACFMTACVAGLLAEEPGKLNILLGNSTSTLEPINSTIAGNL